MNRKWISVALIVVFCLTLTSVSASATAPNGTLDFGTTADDTAATAGNTGFGGVRVGTGGGSFTIKNSGQEIGAQAELRGIAPTAASINSVGVTSTEFGTAATTFSVAFEVYFSGGSSGTWYFFAGNGASFGSAQSTGFTGSQVFTGLRFVYGASDAITTTNRAAGAWNATGITGTPFAQNAPYTVSIIGNNSAATVNYGSSQSVAANTYDLWVNGVLVGNDLAKAQLAATTDINAFRFYGESSTGNVAAIAIDNIRWWNQAVAPSTSTYSTVSAVPANTYTDLNANSGPGSLSGDVTVERVLTLAGGDISTGANTLTMNSSATSSGEYDVVGNTKRSSLAVGTAYSFGHPDVKITFSGSVPTDVTVNLVKTQPASYAVDRDYTITQNGAFGTATLRLRYKDSELHLANGATESNLKLFKNVSGVWTKQAASVVDTVNNYVELTGVTGFSEWTVSGNVPATAVSLRTLSATPAAAAVPWAAALPLAGLIAAGAVVYRRRRAG